MDHQQAILKVAETRQENDLAHFLTYGMVLLQVFTRKHLLSLQPDALKYLLGILEEHGIAPEDVVSSLDIIAQEYLNQDGRQLVFVL